MPAPVWIGQRQYVRAPSPIHFRSEEPLEEAVSETKRHLEARTTLYLLLKDALAGSALGSDQFVYYDATNPQRCLAPDIFVKRDSRETNFDVWKVWQGGAPDLAVEIVSASDRRDDDWDDKLARYRDSGIAELVRFDPADAKRPVRVWDRIEGDLVERAATSPHLHECLTLALWWAVAPSEFGPQLRLARDRDGKDLLPTPAEERRVLARQLAEERKARAVAEHERLVAEHAAKEEALARIQAERERDAALADLAKLRAAAAKKAPRKRRPAR